MNIHQIKKLFWYENIFSAVFKWKKKTLTQAACENIFSTIENRVLFSFIYKIEI